MSPNSKKIKQLVDTKRVSNLSTNTTNDSGHYNLQITTRLGYHCYNSYELWKKSVLLRQIIISNSEDWGTLQSTQIVRNSTEQWPCQSTLQKYRCSCLNKVLHLVYDLWPVWSDKIGHSHNFITTCMHWSQSERANMTFQFRQNMDSMLQYATSNR